MCNYKNDKSLKLVQNLTWEVKKISRKTIKTLHSASQKNNKKRNTSRRLIYLIFKKVIPSFKNANWSDNKQMKANQVWRL